MSNDLWTAALALRDAVMPTLPHAVVELDRDPAANIGGLHIKLADVRAHANKVRDYVFQALLIGSGLRRQAVVAKMAYDAAYSKRNAELADTPAYKALKTKEERELLVRASLDTEYGQMMECEARVDEWEDFKKALNTIYFSLNGTRDDISTQVQVLKQQMFNGEIKPNKDLEKLGSLGELLGSAGKAFIQAGQADPQDEPVTVGAKSGETDW